MRRAPLALFSLVLALAVGCGGDDEPSAENDGPEVTQSTTRPEPTKTSTTPDAAPRTTGTETATGPAATTPRPRQQPPATGGRDPGGTPVSPAPRDRPEEDPPAPDARAERPERGQSSDCPTTIRLGPHRFAYYQRGSVDCGRARRTVRRLYATYGREGRPRGFTCRSRTRFRQNGSCKASTRVYFLYNRR